MLRFILLISLLLSSLTLVESTSATVIYTPGASIAMTGSNTDARFDVASALYDLQLANPADEVKNPPALDRDTRTFTGTFYGSGIGWIVFASGSNQVSLDCGIQSIASLTANCTLTGTGWNENVGDIYFAGVVYNPGTGRLSGSAITFV